MKFLLFESFYGGSHRAFADSLTTWSRHDIDLMRLPARFWKWRMRGAALEFSRKMPDPITYQGLIVTDLIDLSALKVLCRCQALPTLLYFHESQLTYPVAPGESVDYHYGFTDIVNALAADRVLFNSRSHMDRFFSRLPEFINMMPDSRPRWAINRILAKAGVCHPGCELSGRQPKAPKCEDPPLIIWNHRWEHDKNPESFFNALYAVARSGIEFQLAVLGETFTNRPPVFDEARQKLGDRIVRFGYAPSKNEYIAWLNRGTVVISTAIQENFGMSVIEAVASGCMPLLPNRLSYPEIMPADIQAEVLYDTETDLIEKLSAMLLHPMSYAAKLEGLVEKMNRFSWENRIADFDAELETLAGMQRQPIPGQ